MPYDREGEKQGFFSDDINEKDDMQIERERERDRCWGFFSAEMEGERDETRSIFHFVGLKESSSSNMEGVSERRDVGFFI